MRSTVLWVLVASAFASASVTAEESPYAGFEGRTIKALSEEQVADYLGGKGMGMAMPGELNGYPGPKHVLELATELQLSDEQRAEVEGVFEAMQARAMALGRRIVAAEAALDAQFADGSIDAEGLERATIEIGRLQGELRAAHLQAHLETKALLSRHQVGQYNELRGYGGAGHSHHGRHGHGH